MTRALLFLIALLTLTACGGNEPPPPTPTPQPPMLTMVIPLETSPENVNFLVQQLTNRVEASAGFRITVEVVETQAEALNLLCAPPALPVVAWLDALGAVAGVEMGCGQPSVQVGVAVAADATTQPAPTPDATPESDEPTPDNAALQFAEPVLIIVDDTLGTTDLTLADGRTACRLSLTDSASWLIPSALLSGVGVGVDELAAVNDYEDVPALVGAVADADCTLTGVRASDFALVDADVQDEVTVALTTPGLPYNTLVVPLTLDEGVRLALRDAVVALAPDDAELVTGLFGGDAVAPADLAAFDALRAFFADTGLDFGVMGQ